MNISKLKSYFDLCRFSGHTLSTEQILDIESSVFVLKADKKYQEMFLWGTICGGAADYHIIYGYKTDLLAGREYYYSHDYINWNPLPQPSTKAKNLSTYCTTSFQGTPDVVIDALLNNPIDCPEEQTNAIDDTQPVGTTENQTTEIAGDLKEEDRVAATIYLINEDALIVPRGSLFKRIDSQVAFNRSFEGITSEAAAQLKAFQHFRYPQFRWHKNLLQKPDYNYALDFLDTINHDIPERYAWSTIFQHGGALVLLRSLYWPGMIFFHKINTPDFGTYYYGTGKRNIDILFMLEKM